MVTLALYTGQRRFDLCAMQWSQYDGRSIHLTQIKTKESLVVPCHPNLKLELDTWKRAEVVGTTILLDAHGKPWVPTLLSQYMRAALVRLALDDGLNVHGLRKLAATNLANAGATAHQIMAINGHRALVMVELYTKAAEQVRLAGDAIRLLAGSDKSRRIGQILEKMQQHQVTR